MLSISFGSHVSFQDLSSSSATPLADASHLHPGIPPVLSVSLMSAANTTLHPHPQQLQQASYPKGDTAATEDLSIVPLDSTLLSTSQMAAPEEPSGSVVDLATLQGERSGGGGVNVLVISMMNA